MPTSGEKQAWAFAPRVDKLLPGVSASSLSPPPPIEINMPAQPIIPACVFMGEFGKIVEHSTSIHNYLKCMVNVTFLTFYHSCFQYEPLMAMLLKHYKWEVHHLLYRSRLQCKCIVHNISGYILSSKCVLFLSRKSFWSSPSLCGWETSLHRPNDCCPCHWKQ